jgi:hypothetical protein
VYSRREPELPAHPHPRRIYDFKCFMFHGFSSGIFSRIELLGTFGTSGTLIQ